MSNTNNLFEARDLCVSYGDSRIINDVSFAIGQGESVAIMGRNGMGKTTLLKALIGILGAKSGSIVLEGDDITTMETYKRVGAGLAYVPQGRMIFPSLTVTENILTGLGRDSAPKVPDEIYELFPALKELGPRRGGNLSGGQQQQLAIARALVTKPKLLLLDEPTEGIQPSIIKDIARSLCHIRDTFGISVLVTEQSLSFTMDLAERFLIIENGCFVHEEQRATIDEEKIKSFMTV